MKTLLILWFATTGSVATNSVKSMEFETVAQCEGYATVVMADKDKKAEQYQCIEGYSLYKGVK